jgi:hypothetical protein
LRLLGKLKSVSETRCADPWTECRQLPETLRRAAGACCNAVGTGRVVPFRVMGSTGLKQRMVETVEHLPESATVEDAIEHLYFLAKLERGLEQSTAGETIPHQEIKTRFLG